MAVNDTADPSGPRPGRWRKTGRAAGALLLVSGGGVLLAAGWFERPRLALAAAIVAGLAGAGLLVDLLYQLALSRDAQDQAQLEAARERTRSEPRAQATWELGRLKLESYLNRNLDQVRAIFWLAAGVMVAGFGLIGAGVAHLLFSRQSGLEPAIISAASGILVEFIGATLMSVYRSTMAQAQGYMKVLERINAVGMSVQILEGIEGDAPMKNRALVSVAERLLVMYAEPESPPTDAMAPSGPPPDISLK